MQSSDVLIVGQGLAGSVLAWELIQRGLQVLVVDDGHRTSSTRMAAGLLNPVTGWKLTKVRQADAFLSRAHATYAALEQALGIKVLHRKPMLRVFTTDKQRAAWSRRLEDPAYAGYLDEPLAPGAAPCRVDDASGSGVQHHTGYLDTVTLLDAVRHWLQERDAYCQAAFDWRDIELKGDAVLWDGRQVRHVIGCEGYRGKDHPWFPWLSLQPSKGQILTLESDTALPDWIINKGKWLLPIDLHRARFGATYEREGLEDGPTAEAGEQLMQVAHHLMRGEVNWRLVKQEAGVRPGTRDRMPVLGLHPEHRQLGMFNGFGSKGVMMVPYYAAMFADALLGRGAIASEVNLERYWHPAGEGQAAASAPPKRPLQVMAHDAVLAVLGPGDVAVDATVGNGHDTVLLADAVGAAGRVFGFDVQAAALESTRRRLQQAGLAEQVTLYPHGHELLGDLIPGAYRGRVKAVMFNLGYLPRRDKSCVTRLDTTLAALQQGLEVLAPGGVISVTAYTGHPGGQAEAEGVRAWASALSPELATVKRRVNTDPRGPNPELTLITKPDQPGKTGG